MYQLADTDKAFIYELNTNGTNKWNAIVQPGFGEDTQWFPRDGCEKVAQLMASAPDMLRVLENVASWCDDEGFYTEHTAMQMKTLLRGIHKELEPVIRQAKGLT